MGLEADNSKAYFSAHCEFFDEAIRGQMQAMLDELSAMFGGEVKLFRQNRDIRFSPDKSPYKTNTYGILRGSDFAPQGLYASISADGLVAGSGYHVMARDQLERYRERGRRRREWARARGRRGRGPQRRPRTVGREPPHDAARLSEGPPADRAAAPQEPVLSGRGRRRDVASAGMPRSSSSPAPGAPRGRSRRGSMSNVGPSTMPERR